RDEPSPRRCVADERFVGQQRLGVRGAETVQLHNHDAGPLTLQLGEIQRQLARCQDETTPVLALGKCADQRGVAIEFRTKAAFVLTGLKEAFEIVQYNEATML